MKKTFKFIIQIYVAEFIVKSSVGVFFSKTASFFIFFFEYFIEKQESVSLQAAAVQLVVSGALHVLFVLCVQQCAILLVFSSSPSPLDLVTSVEDKADEIRH